MSFFGPPQQKWGKGNVDAQGNVIDPTLDYDGNPLPPDDGKPGFFSELLGLNTFGMSPKQDWGKNGIDPFGRPYPKGQEAKTGRVPYEAPPTTASERRAMRDRAETADARVAGAFSAPAPVAPEQQSGLGALPQTFLTDAEMGAPAQTEEAPATFQDPYAGLSAPAAVSPEEMMTGIAGIQKQLEGDTSGGGYDEYEKFLRDDLAETQAKKPGGAFGADDLLRYGLALSSTGDYGKAGQQLMEFRDNAKAQYKKDVRDNMKSMLDLQIARRADEMNMRSVSANLYANYLNGRNAQDNRNLEIQKLSIGAKADFDKEQRDNAREDAKARQAQADKLSQIEATAAGRLAAKQAGGGGYSDSAANNIDSGARDMAIKAVGMGTGGEYDLLVSQGKRAEADKLLKVTYESYLANALSSPSAVRLRANRIADGSSDDDAIIEDY